MSGFLAALSFLTILPVHSRMGERLSPARAYFPLVGLLLGGGLALLDLGLRQVLPLSVASGLLMAALVAATRGIHLEGFLDCCDALFGGFSRERRLEILADPHVGAFGLIGGGLLLLLTWTALSAVPAPVRTTALLLFPCLSRWAMLLAMASFPYARQQGLGTAFAKGANPWQVLAGLLTATAAALLLAGWAGLLLVLAASVVAMAFGAWSTRLLGGLTGDGYGAANELSALAVLLLTVGLAQRWPALFARLGMP